MSFSFSTDPPAMISRRSCQEPKVRSATVGNEWFAQQGQTPSCFSPLKSIRVAIFCPSALAARVGVADALDPQFLQIPIIADLREFDRRDVRVA
jgi:hypothetical protein